MATQTYSKTTCDVEGIDTPAVATHYFSLDGESYAVDLGETQDKVFLNAFAEWIEFSRKDKGPKPVTKLAATPAKPRSTPSSVVAKIREWAKANGFPEIAGRGRIPQEIQDAYYASGAD